MNEYDWLELPPDEFLRAWYRDEYDENAYGGSAGRIQAWMHRSLELGHSSSEHYGSVLELGGNRGEHVPFVMHTFDEYVVTDLHRPDAGLMPGLEPTGSVHFTIADAQRLPFVNASFDRVLHTCLLHHVDDPERVLLEARRVLRPGAIADLFVSADPGALFRLARRLGPVRMARKRGLGTIKSLVDARDHRHHVGGLSRLIRHVFREDLLEERSYPLGVPGWNFALWKTYRVRRSPAA